MTTDQAAPAAVPEHDNDADFVLLFDLIAQMVEAPRGSAIPPGQGWLNDRQTLAKKFVYHLSTILSVRGGSTLVFDGAVHEFTDHGSLTVLVRAVLENFVVFAYVFGSKDLEECRFRHLCWHFGGMMDRQKRLSITPAGRNTQAVEKLQADSLLESIKVHPAFKLLSNGRQKAIVKGKWDGGQQWHELAVEVGLNEAYFRTIYSYLCDYSHSSYAAALQVGQADTEAQDQMSKSMLGVMNLCMAKFAVIHAACFASSRKLLEESPARAAVTKWDIDSARFEQIYSSNRQDAIL